MFKGKRGFTLLEIMVVVILISLLGTFVAVKVVARGESAKKKLTQAQIRGLLTGALGSFHLDNGFYPTTQQGLEALVEKPAGGAELVDYEPDGYLDEVLPDPWGVPYYYECPGTHNTRRFDLWSSGPDRQSGTEDDIVNWRRK